MALIKVVEQLGMKDPVSIIDKINIYAKSAGLTRKNGAYFKDGKFYGTLFAVGREGKIDMQEYR